MAPLNYHFLLTATLLVLLAATVSSGLLSAAWDLHRFAYHKYVAYALVMTLCLHLYLRRRALLARLGLREVPARRQAMAPLRATGGFAPWASLPGRWGLNRRSFLVSASAALAGLFVGRFSAPGPQEAWAGGQDLGEAYHQWSKPSRASLMRLVLGWGKSPPLYKTYPQAKKIPLPREMARGGMSLEEAIQKRRSVRDYSRQPLSLAELARLLHSGGGITEPTYPLRAAPSAGALYPVELYAVVNRVEGLPKGIYHYSPRDHSLELVKEGDFGLEMMRHAVGQEMVWHAAAVLVLTAIFQRTRVKYGERAYRYVLLDAGHVGENIYLAATSLGLGPCGIGAFFDDDLSNLLGIDGKEEAPLYLVAVGKR